MFRGKKYKEIAKQIDKATLYDPAEALALVVKTATAKFDETVELHVKLGVDSRHADQQVRGAVVLPNGTGFRRRHQATRTKHFTKTADNAHHVRRSDDNVEFHPAFALNLLEVFVGTGVISTGVQCFLHTFVVKLLPVKTTFLN